MLTWIFPVVLGSRKDFTVFHKSLNPEPALMMYIRFRVYGKQTTQYNNHHRIQKLLLMHEKQTKKLVKLEMIQLFT